MPEEKENSIHLPQPKKKKSALPSAFEWVSSLIVSILIVSLVFTFLFRMVYVNGESMCNTLQNKDRLILSSCFYHINRGDIVVIHRMGEEPLIKRVIAMEGDVIEFTEDGSVILNGLTVSEPYIRDGITPSFDFETPYTVPEGYIFAMGDNRCESKDSRMLGAFSTRNVVGVVLMRVSPVDQFTWLRGKGVIV